MALYATPDFFVAHMGMTFIAHVPSAVAQRPEVALVQPAPAAYACDGLHGQDQEGAIEPA
jgi:hypothetical protein